MSIEPLEIKPDSITLDYDSIQLFFRSTRQLHAMVYPFFTSNVTIDWLSSYPDIVSVNKGKIIAKNSGSAFITATLNGSRISATCKVTVEPPVYLDSAFFDFGTKSSPLAPGAIRIHEKSIMNNSYGFDNISVLESGDRRHSSLELKDMVFAKYTATFRVFLKNGTYSIEIAMGDASWIRDNMSVYANGTHVASSVSAQAGQFEILKFEVTVDEGYLELTFQDNGGRDANWAVNYIKIGLHGPPAKVD